MVTQKVPLLYPTPVREDRNSVHSTRGSVPNLSNYAQVVVYRMSLGDQLSVKSFRYIYLCNLISRRRSFIDVTGGHCQVSTYLGSLVYSWGGYFRRTTDTYLGGLTSSTPHTVVSFLPLSYPRYGFSFPPGQLPGTYWVFLLRHSVSRNL